MKGKQSALYDCFNKLVSAATTASEDIMTADNVIAAESEPDSNIPQSEWQ